MLLLAFIAYTIFSTLTIARLASRPFLNSPCLKSISMIHKFNRDILNFRIDRYLSYKSIQPCWFLQYIGLGLYIVFSYLLNKHAPLKTKTSLKLRTHGLLLPWLKPKLKSARRRLEKIWLRTRSLQDLRSLRSATNAHHSSIIHFKRLQLISSQPVKLNKQDFRLGLHRKPVFQLTSI